MIEVALVDDHHLFREGLAALLERDAEFRVVAQGSSSNDAARIAEQHQPAIMLLDVEIDTTPAPATLRAVHRLAPSTRVVMLTMHKDEILKKHLLGLGAAGFFAKSMLISDLQQALRRTLQEENPEPNTQLPSPNALLTDRELEVLRLLSGGRSNREIGKWLFIAEGTVKRHVSSILMKLEARSRMSAVARAELLGILGGR